MDGSTVKKRPEIGALLSLLLPGIGHFYYGQTKKALLYQFVNWSLLLIAWFSPILNSFHGFVFLFIVCLIYNLALTVIIFRRIEASPWVKKKKFDNWIAYVIIMASYFLIGTIIYIPMIHSLSQFNTSKAATTAMNPMLTNGDYFTWKRTKDIHRNEVVVFESPKDLSQRYVYRCVAIPGDKIEIIESNVYVNDQKEDNQLLELRHLYRINTRININPLKLKRFGICDIYRNSDGYLAHLSQNDINNLNQIISEDQIIQEIRKKGDSDENLFPYDQNSGWNIDFYGPIVIPKKNMRVELNRANAIFYGSVILAYENEPNIIINSRGLLEINGKQITSYTFKNNYYFMLGDNRCNANDSRYL